MTEWLTAVMVDSYFETLLKKNDNVPPMSEINPKKIKINPKITMMIAIHLGIHFLSSHLMG